MTLDRFAREVDQEMTDGLSKELMLKESVARFGKVVPASKSFIVMAVDDHQDFPLDMFGVEHGRGKFLEMEVNT